MSREVVISELIQQETRQLKMPGAARAFESLGRQAREEKWSFEDYLHEAFAGEIVSCRESAVRQRIRDARFPETKTLDQCSLLSNRVGQFWRSQVGQFWPGGSTRHPTWGLPFGLAIPGTHDGGQVSISYPPHPDEIVLHNAASSLGPERDHFRELSFRPPRSLAQRQLDLAIDVSDTPPRFGR